DEEVYRIGIKFSKNGRFSEPKWIADFRAPEGNLLGNYNILRFNIKPSFYTFLDTLSANDKPDGYMIVVAERTESDKTIVANGIVNPMMMMDINRKDVRYPHDKDYIKERSSRMLKMPNFLFRNFSSSGNPTNIYPMREMDNYAEMSMSRSTDTEIMRAEAGDRDTFARFYQYNAMFQLYSPESIFDFRSNLTSNLKFK